MYTIFIEKISDPYRSESHLSQDFDEFSKHQNISFMCFLANTQVLSRFIHDLFVRNIFDFDRVSKILEILVFYSSEI